MFLHIFYSWLLTQVFHPVLLVSLNYITWTDDDFFSLNFNDIPAITLFSSIISLPCLFAGWLFLGFIIYSGYTVPAKFFLWLLATATLVVLNFWIPMLIAANGEVELRYLLIAIPGILSIWFASIIRIKQFQKLISVKNNLQEDDMDLGTKN